MYVCVDYCVNPIEKTPWKGEKIMLVRIIFPALSVCEPVPEDAHGVAPFNGAVM